MGNCCFGPCVGVGVPTDGGCSNAVGVTEKNSSEGKQPQQTEESASVMSAAKLNYFLTPATKIHSSLQSIEIINLGEINS